MGGVAEINSATILLKIMLDGSAVTRNKSSIKVAIQMELTVKSSSVCILRITSQLPKYDGGICHHYHVIIKCQQQSKMKYGSHKFLTNLTDNLCQGMSSSRASRNLKKISLKKRKSQFWVETFWKAKLVNWKKLRFDQK